jgi:hypothetical protein
MRNSIEGRFEPLLIISNAISGGGAEKSMLALHQQLISRGIDCHLLALNQSYADKNIINLRVLSRSWKDGFKSTFLNFVNFKKIIKEIKPKSIIVNCELAELYVSLINHKHLRIICVEHTTFPWYKKRVLGIFVRNILRLKKSEWVTVSKDMKKIWLARNIPKYLPNPFIGEETILAQKATNLSLVFIGGIKENKRPEWVIMAGLKNNLDVNLYGTGNLEKSLKNKYSNESQLIKFHGYRENVWELVPRNSLVIVPSKFEGDGMVVVEATILGFPILLSSTVDLLKFGFQEKHYFRDLNELMQKVSTNLMSSFSELVVKKSEQEALRIQRSVGTIADKWHEILLDNN